MELKELNGKLYVVSNYTTGNKAWLARLTGSHPKFNFDREFLNGTRKGLKLSEVKPGDILEEVIFSHSGRTRDTYYYRVDENYFSIDKEGEADKYMLTRMMTIEVKEHFIKLES